jgi:hypothetical protein
MKAWERPEFKAGMMELIGRFEADVKAPLERRIVELEAEIEALKEAHEAYRDKSNDCIVGLYREMLAKGSEATRTRTLEGACQA